MGAAAQWVPGTNRRDRRDGKGWGRVRGVGRDAVQEGKAGQ